MFLAGLIDRELLQHLALRRRHLEGVRVGFLEGWFGLENAD